MNKQAFLARLRSGLSQLPAEAQEEPLNFYSEMLDDRIEEGLTEEEAVKALGDLEHILAQIYAEVTLSAPAKKKITPKRKRSPWEIALLVLGSPIWLSLLLAVFAGLFSFVVSLWSVVISLWAVFAGLAACSIGFLASSVRFLIQGYGLSGLAVIGGALILAGLSIFCFFGCKAVTKWAARSCKSLAKVLKKFFTRKEEAL
ncbi:MAG: DUF1700 domain-containing protein [Oscillospiraceae bacterium]|nr:DUF1700 domain-containing protein [Oscillospiraceae bacterium]